MLKIDARKITILMQYKALNGAQLAKSAGISPTSLSSLMTGKSAPRSSTLQKLCGVLGCEPADILEDPEE